MKIIFVSVSILIVFSLNIFSQTAPERDVQFWSDAQVSIPLVKKKDKNGKEVEKISFFVTGVLRGGKNITRFVDERIGAGVDISINRYLSVTPSYLYRAGQPFANRKEYEHRLRFDASLEKKWTSFSIKDRNRVEYRIRHSRADSVRYRNKFQFKIPVKNDGKEIFAPFVATEPFYDFSAKAWTRNEFSAGISKKFTPRTSADFFYLLQNNRGNAFKYVNVIGVSLKYKVD